jgi:hypothetical protein
VECGPVLIQRVRAALVVGALVGSLGVAGGVGRTIQTMQRTTENCVGCWNPRLEVEGAIQFCSTTHFGVQPPLPTGYNRVLCVANDLAHEIAYRVTGRMW